MIALTRLCLQNVNIVAATALDALEGAVGRERALQAGANVVMLNYTPLKYRAAYDLYPGKANA
jgi:biotin synthase